MEAIVESGVWVELKPIEVFSMIVPPPIVAFCGALSAYFRFVVSLITLEGSEGAVLNQLFSVLQEHLTTHFGDVEPQSASKASAVSMKTSPYLRPETLSKLPETLVLLKG